VFGKNSVIHNDERVDALKDSTAFGSMDQDALMRSFAVALGLLNYAEVPPRSDVLATNSEVIKF
jgi:hypothetical protein